VTNSAIAPSLDLDLALEFERATLVVRAGVSESAAADHRYSTSLEVN
jgi:hypothetical protein